MLVNNVLLEFLNVLPPLIFTLSLKVADPVTPKLPPSVVVPVPTVSVLLPVTDVAPLSKILPVAVLKVPAPAWLKLPLFWE